MAAFPSLPPSSGRTYSPGEYPHTVHRSYSGREVRVRHSAAVVGIRASLSFLNIVTADSLLIADHYRGQRGRAFSFIIPDELFNGIDTPEDFTPAGYNWRYVAKPKVADVAIAGSSPSNRHNVTVELQAEKEIAPVFAERVIFRLRAHAPLVISTTPFVVPAAAFTLTAYPPVVSVSTPPVLSSDGLFLFIPSAAASLESSTVRLFPRKP